ncbi:outer membrane protein assembly factor BamB family protein [Novipirellula artificiosorum]|uniref:Outer membrane biogenesis protein BamB n=1 Tax=Novipirellula artificiosorum TaxID=2528016 RepID=A0A5C6DEW6_9BACT|nr:PQQ-binding-like beta-propeller repeat protein [Novipirellula artificiosorum]TWU34367.1 outer membrane biogenesis protein BamB [Novipirellula artificiosorum]
MTRRRRTLMITTFCLFFSLATSWSCAEDWTQFRGSDYGRTAEVDVAQQWDSGGVAWKTPLQGRGASSPVVFGNRIYLTAYTGYGIDPESPGNASDLVRHVLCIGVEDGNLIWQQSVPAISDKNEFNTWGVGLHGYASSTPAVDNTGVYVFFGASGVLAFDHQGTQRWRADVGSGTHAFGSGTSPVLHNEMVIVNACVESGDLVALKKTDGSEVWRQSGIDEAWNSPVIYKALDGSDELAVTMKKKIMAFNPNTGQPLWTCDGIDDYICPHITVEDGILFAGGGRRSRTLAIRSGGRGDVTDSHQLWDVAKGSNVSSAVYHDGFLYWAKEKSGILYCADASTGEIQYEQRIDPSPDLIYASPLWADGRLYYVSRKNGIFVVAAKPRFELLSHTQLDGDDSAFNASPVPLPGGAVLLRSDKFLYRIKPAT